jgi:YVTN family beta-propeller protein
MAAMMGVAAVFISHPVFAQPFAYITNQLGDSVSVIDAKTNTVQHTIPVKGKPAGVAVSRDGTRVYVSTPEAQGVAVIDTQKKAVIATIPLSEGALGIAVSPDNARLYVADWYAHSVSVIDTHTLQIVGSIAVEK